MRLRPKLQKRCLYVVFSNHGIAWVWRARVQYMPGIASKHHGFESVHKSGTRGYIHMDHETDTSWTINQAKRGRMISVWVMCDANDQFFCASVSPQSGSKLGSIIMATPGSIIVLQASSSKVFQAVLRCRGLLPCLNEHAAARSHRPVRLLCLVTVMYGTSSSAQTSAQPGCDCYMLTPTPPPSDGAEPMPPSLTQLCKF